jgi:hypothetical protein
MGTDSIFCKILMVFNRGLFSVGYSLVYLQYVLKNTDSTPGCYFLKDTDGIVKDTDAIFLWILTVF